ncbi:hypothetical protein KIH74_27230 [Kineosporia sp. J2-2]|uniref:SGNH hydrolase-type esterase domain-containing protein n=1 Tax=Kineosporia corallincola TaxID=2835133 RepID=A0ABS5TNI8_9ACTN|nr:GDSL-type esterase/lipase family protein [Kineosporia corallincola]MBT0772667.1 hypothetical protein [Kineosporia corallincola]
MKKTRRRALTASLALFSVGAITGTAILVTTGHETGLAAVPVGSGDHGDCITAAFPGESGTVASSPAAEVPRPSTTVTAPQHVQAGWSGAWSTAVQDLSDTADRDVTGRTVRQLVHPTLGGSSIRMRLVNTFGTEPLELARVTVALAVKTGAPELTTGTVHEVTFSGAARAEVPPGGRVISDPVELPIDLGDTLAVDVVTQGATVATSGHARAVATTFLGPGDLAGRTSGAAFTDSVRSWYWLEGVDVPDPGGEGSVSMFGDSITEGIGSTPDHDRRWPDLLAARMRGNTATAGLGVLNEGIGGNRLTSENVNCGSPSASGLRRFEHDVLARPEVRVVVIALGINDIGTGTPATTVIAGLTTLADRAHAGGLRVVGATLTPFTCEGGCLSPEKEQQRRLVNDWVRSTTVFDAVVDFDAAVADPAAPERMGAAHDSGDHLHPGDAGMRALAEAFDLAALTG